MSRFSEIQAPNYSQKIGSFDPIGKTESLHTQTPTLLSRKASPMTHWSSSLRTLNMTIPTIRITIAAPKTMKFMGSMISTDLRNGNMI